MLFTCCRIFYFSFRAINKGLSLPKYYTYWIGLSDRQSEGNYVWVNGNEASATENGLWASEEPNSSGDCCSAYFYKDDLEVYDGPCYLDIHGAVCEKPVLC